MIELRPKISGNYKGYIYCDSLDEARNIQSKLSKLLIININENITSSVKRGCSEFSIEYPKYKKVQKNNTVRYVLHARKGKSNKKKRRQ